MDELTLQTLPGGVPLPAVIGKFEFSLLEDKDYEESARIVAEVFTTSNPLAVGTNTTEEEFFQYIMSLKGYFMSAKLSVVAKCVKTKRIASVCLTQDYNIPIDEKLSSLWGPNIKKTDSLFTYIGEVVKSQGGVTDELGKYIHCLFGATHRDFANQRVIEWVGYVTSTVCTPKGFKYVVAEVTAPAT